MKSIKGNKTLDLSSTEFNQLQQKFEKVVVDMGTGDARFVYKNALANPSVLFVGIDPAQKQLEEFSKKAVRKKLDNALFIVGSFELLPSELAGSADKLYINLPWGSLLKAVAEPTAENLETIKSLLKPDAELEMVFGYDAELEPSQTNRLQLDEIDENKIIQKFENAGFTLIESTTLLATGLKKMETTWGKRISETTGRKIFKLVFKI